MRATSSASIAPRPSSLMLVAIEPGMTLNSTNTTMATAATVGSDCSRRRTANANINVLLRWRALVDPDVFRILVRQLGCVRLQPVDPGLIGHHGLVVVEEPDRRFLVENVTRLAQQRVALVVVVGLTRLVEQLVELRVLETVVVAGGHRRRRMEAF